MADLTPTETILVSTNCLATEDQTVKLICVSPDWWMLRVDVPGLFSVAFFGRDEHEVRAKWYDFAHTTHLRIRQQQSLDQLRKDSAA